MKKHLLSLLLFSVVMPALSQRSTTTKQTRMYAVAFYNVENLFDTIHDEGKNDYEYLPGGTYRWDSEKYKAKLANLSRAIADIATDVLPKDGAAVVGLAEVENSRVLGDLVDQLPLSDRDYRFVHHEGPDRRGIDCALLYNPHMFTPSASRLVGFRFEPQDTGRTTRGFLVVSGKLAGDPVSFVVCHWPSRLGGKEASERLRISAARQVRAIKDSLLSLVPQPKVFVMGDMNDDPSDRALAEGIPSAYELSEVADSCMYNPWRNVLEYQGVGTLSFRGRWNLFDQILLSPNLLSVGGKADYSSLCYYRCQVVKRDYLTNADGPFKGTPRRTSTRNAWLNGYSDHFPVVVYLMKRK